VFDSHRGRSIATRANGACSPREGSLVRSAPRRVTAAASRRHPV